MQAESRNLKVLQGRETANKLLAIARKAFAKQGYAATRTGDIITQANVTKGALYHHYPSKRHLFEAVYRAVEDEAAERIAVACEAATNPWDRLLEGCYAYMETCQDPEFRRIMRIDAPAVLGMEKWSEIDREYGVQRLLPALQSLLDAGVIDVPVVEAFTWQLTGAMNEATFWIAQHHSPDTALHESKKALRLILESVKVQ